MTTSALSSDPATIKQAFSAHPSFVAIDFETANPWRNSACSIGVVRVEKGRIKERFSSLIRPPSGWFTFTEIHGITWNDVRNEQTFGQLWPRLSKLLGGVDFLVAHNAPFDRGVLEACCEHWKRPLPGQPFLCTVKMARACWNLRPTKLPDVAKHLGLELRHHDALSDAEACARIVLQALRE